MSREHYRSGAHRTKSSSSRLDALLDQAPELARARDYGVDFCMLFSNLERSVKERIERHQIALDTFHKLRYGRIL